MCEVGKGSRCRRRSYGCFLGEEGKIKNLLRIVFHRKPEGLRPRKSLVDVVGFRVLCASVYCILLLCRWSSEYDVFDRINNVKSSNTPRIFFFFNISLLVSVRCSEIALPPTLQKYCCAVSTPKRFTLDRTATVSIQDDYHPVWVLLSFYWSRKSGIPAGSCCLSVSDINQNRRTEGLEDGGRFSRAFTA